MVTRYITFAEGEFYHVYNRGTDKRVIYKDVADYRRFQELLYLSNSTESINVRDIKKGHKNVYDFEKSGELVAIGAYCLMPNHFHILLTPLVENGVSIFMAKLATSYSMYFNKTYNRKGTLYEGRFKGRWVDSDNYLKYLYAYIHLNPVKLIQPDWKEKGIRDIDGAYKYVLEYNYSSLLDYTGNRPASKILKPDLFPEYFTTPTSYKRELIEWLKWENLQIKI